MRLISLAAVLATFGIVLLGLEALAGLVTLVGSVSGAILAVALLAIVLASVVAVGLQLAKTTATPYW